MLEGEEGKTVPAPAEPRQEGSFPLPPRIPWEFFRFSQLAEADADPLRDLFPLRTYEK